MKSRIVMQLGLAAAAMLILFAPTSARADFINFDLGTGNSAISGYTGPFANVNVDRTDSTHATITFTSLINSGNIYLMGSTAVAVNVNASSWSAGGFTGTNAGTGFTPGPFSNGGSGSMDGFGTFNQTIVSFDGFTHSSDKISLTLTDMSGTWATASDVLAPNSGGHLAAAHIFVTSSPANADNKALATGFAADGKQELSVVPAPSSMIAALTGMALFGVIGIAGYRRRARAMLGA